MSGRVFTTNLRCAGCLDTLAPHLDQLAGLDDWSVDLQREGKPLTVIGSVSEAALRDAVRRAGYELGPALVTPAPATSEPAPSYYPLILLLAILLAGVAALEHAAGSLDHSRMMRHFMGGFLIAFAFFKLLDLKGFAASYGMYDLIAARWPAYGLAYPFLELGLGLAYLGNVALVAVNVATLVLMSVGAAGVLRTVTSGRKVRCACLGTVINLPVGFVTILEDAGMAMMAASMLITGRAGSG